MPSPEIERALADGAARSRAAAASEEPGRPSRASVYGAHGAWLSVRLRDLWAHHKWLMIGFGLFLLFDIVAGLAVVASGAHF